MLSVNCGFTNKPVNFMGKSQAPKLLTENPKVLAEKVKSLASKLLTENPKVSVEEVKSQAPKLLTENPKVLAENVKNIAKALELPVDTFVKAVKN